MKTQNHSRILRREFLKTSLAGAASLGLSSCTTFENIITAESSDNTDRVVVLGAGMSGLRAAYELRKAQIPFRIFEGSARLGGRAWTLESFTAADQSAELGAEWFSKDLPDFATLAKELKLEIVEVKGQRDHLLLEQNSELSRIPTSDLQSLRRIYKKKQSLTDEKVSTAQEKNGWLGNFKSQHARVSLKDWGQILSADSAWDRMLEAWTQLRFSTSADQVRASVFAAQFLFSDQAIDAWSGDRFRFRGGASSLASAMADRVVGAIPGERLRFSHRLIRVEKSNAGYELHFETPQGRRRIRALHVICALPWACLKEIEGFEKFDSGREVLLQPQVTHSAKGLFVFQDRFWRKHWDQGRVLGTKPWWESSYRLVDAVPTPWGILSRSWSGDQAALADPTLLTSALQDLQSLEKLPAPPVAADSQIHSWTASQWARARGSYPSLTGTESIFQAQPGTWVWAGEHAADEENLGTWAGALKSGAAAAGVIARKVDRLGLFR